MATTRGLPLGFGPRPTAGDEFVARVRTAGAAALGRVALGGIEIDGLDDARVDAVIEHADIASLHVDVSGLAITLPATDDPGDAGDFGSANDADSAAPSPETRRTGGILRSGTLAARPATLAGAPVELDLVIAQLPFVWVERADGTVELDVELDAASGADGLGETSATATVSIAQADLAPLVTQMINLALADVGASVSDLDLTVTSSTPDVVELDATARARYAVMSAGVRLRATATIVDGASIRLEHLDLSTKNLLAGALLGLAKGELEKIDGREFVLAELLPAALRNAEVHVDVTAESLTLRASFGR